MLLGSQQEKRAIGNKMAEEGKFLTAVKNQRLNEEKKRDTFETQRVQHRQQQTWDAQDNAAAAKRSQAMQLARENQQMAELKKRQTYAATVKDQMEQQVNVQKNRH